MNHHVHAATHGRSMPCPFYRRFLRDGDTDSRRPRRRRSDSVRWPIVKALTTLLRATPPRAVRRRDRENRGGGFVFLTRIRGCTASHPVAPGRIRLRRIARRGGAGLSKINPGQRERAPELARSAPAWGHGGFVFPNCDSRCARLRQVARRCARLRGVAPGCARCAGLRGAARGCAIRRDDHDFASFSCQRAPSNGYGPDDAPVQARSARPPRRLPWRDA